MAKLGGLLSSLALLLVPLNVRAQTDVAAPVPPPCAAADVNGPPKPCDPSCNLYSLYVGTGVKFPFDLYVRSGITFLPSNTPLDKAIDTGLALEVGARAFCLDGDKRGAWLADVGIDYFYNRADPTKVIIVKFPNLEVTTLGQASLEPARDQLSAFQLHRTYAKLGGGREWYWGAERPDDPLYVFGVDVGGRYGSFTAKTRLVDRTFLDPTFTPNNNTTFGPTDEGHETHYVKGFYLAVNGGVFIPCCGYDVMLGVRAEYSHDVLRLPGFFTTDSTLDQVQALVSIGIRY